MRLIYFSYRESVGCAWGNYGIPDVAKHPTSLNNDFTDCKSEAARLSALMALPLFNGARCLEKQWQLTWTWDVAASNMLNHSSGDWKDWVKLRSQAEMLRGLWKQTRKEEAEQTFWLAEESDTTLQLSRRKEKEWMENKLGGKVPVLAEEIYLIPKEMALINPWASWEDWSIL